MKFENILIATGLIILLVITMIIFLNPFTWGMRRVEYYEFSEIENSIANDSVFNRVYMENPTKWYMKDCERGYLDKIENLNIRLEEVIDETRKTDTNFLNKKIDFYAENIMASLHEKTCFDSLVIVYSYKTDTSGIYNTNGHEYSRHKAFKIKN
ncbi:hypothetical protein GVN16_19715 [Emticicia sp. CRIBPO]|uniref:hypothetical protein n=1 Tax=Emticicia sp. CRIBPO TaxID=2683258 RepID=UPI0014135CA8|nr:hypothetical protein [Emticicia sp. CRIBPO]NBA88008.1 hypothetical protein [Emticicia sp. CRIBPO]